MHDSTWTQFLSYQEGERGLHQAALVVALLRPWIREKKMDGRERAVGDHVLEHLDAVVADGAQVRELFLLDPVEQAADPGAVHLDGEKIDFRMRLGDLGGGLAHARADLQDERGFSAKNLFRRE